MKETCIHQSATNTLIGIKAVPCNICWWRNWELLRSCGWLDHLKFVVGRFESLSTFWWSPCFSARNSQIRNEQRWFHWLFGCWYSVSRGRVLKSCFYSIGKWCLLRAKLLAFHKHILDRAHYFYFPALVVDSAWGTREMVRIWYSRFCEFPRLQES